MLFLFFSTSNIHETYLKKNEMKNSFFFKQTNMVFKKINTICLKKKHVFSIFFVYCPESLLKICCKLSVKLSGGFASLTETFNANLQGWIESFNANFQGWIESLKKLAGLH